MLLLGVLEAIWLKLMICCSCQPAGLVNIAENQFKSLWNLSYDAIKLISFNSYQFLMPAGPYFD